jgi:uncharacterized protein YcbX
VPLQIYIYPIKSLRPYEARSAVIGQYGFVHDRTFMLVKVHRDEQTGQIEQLQNMHISEFPKMALFLTSLELEDQPEVPQPGNVVVTYVPPKAIPHQDSQEHQEPVKQPEQNGTDARDQIRVPLHPAVDKLETTELSMHQSPTIAYKMGSSYNDWFSSRLGHEVMLVYIGSNSRAVLGNLAPLANASHPQPQSAVSSVFGALRSILPSAMTTAPAANDRIAFQDCAQFLIVTTSSLADVSARLPEGTEMDVTKFRPNIVVSGADGAWVEDFWGEVEVLSPSNTEYGGNGDAGDRPITIILTGNCARCASLNVDYATGAPGTDESGTVLKKLQKDRRVDPGTKYSPIFGRYGFVKPGTVVVGRQVETGMRMEVTRVNNERSKFGTLCLFSSKFFLGYLSIDLL